MSVNLQDTAVSGRAIRTSDVLLAMDPAETNAGTSARTDTLSALIDTIFANPSTGLSAAQKTAFQTALGISSDVSGELLFVTSAPADTVGNDGDSALDTTNGKIYGKASGSWSLKYTAVERPSDAGIGYVRTTLKDWTAFPATLPAGSSYYNIDLDRAPVAGSRLDIDWRGELTGNTVTTELTVSGTVTIKANHEVTFSSDPFTDAQKTFGLVITAGGKDYYVYDKGSGSVDAYIFNAPASDLAAQSFTAQTRPIYAYSDGLSWESDRFHDLPVVPDGWIGGVGDTTRRTKHGSTAFSLESVNTRTNNELSGKVATEVHIVKRNSAGSQIAVSPSLWSDLYGSAAGVQTKYYRIREILPQSTTAAAISNAQNSPGNGVAVSGETMLSWVLYQRASTKPTSLPSWTDNGWSPSIGSWYTTQAQADAGGDTSHPLWIGHGAAYQVFANGPLVYTTPTINAQFDQQFANTSSGTWGSTQLSTSQYTRFRLPNGTYSAAIPIASNGNPWQSITVKFAYSLHANEVITTGVTPVVLDAFDFMRITVEPFLNWSDAGYLTRDLKHHAIIARPLDGWFVNETEHLYTLTYDNDFGLVVTEPGVDNGVRGLASSGIPGNRNARFSFKWGFMDSTDTDGARRDGQVNQIRFAHFSDTYKHNLARWDGHLKAR